MLSVTPWRVVEENFHLIRSHTVSQNAEIQQPGASLYLSSLRHPGYLFSAFKVGFEPTTYALGVRRSIL